MRGSFFFFAWNYRFPFVTLPHLEEMFSHPLNIDLRLELPPIICSCRSNEKLRLSGINDPRGRSIMAEDNVGKNCFVHEGVVGVEGVPIEFHCF